MDETLSLIIGGSTGMGRATAALLVREGRTVLLVGRDAGKLEAAQRTLTAEGPGRVETRVADLTDPASTEALIGALAAEPRQIIHLVNAAGTFFPKSFLDHEPADYDAYAALNRGTFFVTQTVAR
ncbi:MAG: SDR family NAD(P)-dependent oxidoreductase, partial [Elstera sp.]